MKYCNSSLVVRAGPELATSDFLLTGQFLGLFSREIGLFQSTRTSIGKKNITSLGGHVDIVKYDDSLSNVKLSPCL